MGKRALVLMAEAYLLLCVVFLLPFSADAMDSQLEGILSGSIPLDPSHSAVAILDGDRRSQCRAVVFHYLGKNTCYKLEDGETRDRIAIRLLNCELTVYGRHEPYECLDDVPVRACTNSSVMSSEDYSHFHSIRRDLEEQCKQAMDTLSRFAIHDTVSRLAAQAETQLVSLTKEHDSLKAATQEPMNNLEDKQNAILDNQMEFRNQLATTADHLGSKLDHSLDQNDRLLESQKIALENQDHLITITSNVSSTLNDAERRLGGMYEEIIVIHEAMQAVLAIVGYTGGNINFLMSVGFYLFAMLAGMLLTMTTRTRASRIYLFAMLTGELVFERLYISSRSTVGNDMATDDGLWVLRQLTLLAGAGVLIYHSMFYKSAETQMMNNTSALLKQQTAELRALLSAGVGSVMGAPPSAAVEDSDEEDDVDYNPEADEDLPGMPEGQLAVFSLDSEDDESDFLTEEEDEADDWLAEEEKLEFTSDRKLTKEDDDSWQHEIQPVVDYISVAGRQLRRKRTGAKNPVVDFESPEEFIMAHAVWQKAGLWRARVAQK